MNIGLKLWSTNTDFYYEEAKKLYNQNIFDYIELYVVPNTLETIPKWKELNIPYTLHAPHFLHNINLADHTKKEYNFSIFNQVKIFAESLNAQYIVIHGGIEGNLQETIDELNELKTLLRTTLLIENKPYKAPLGKQLLCRGSTHEEIRKIISETNLKFCLDIGHAICTANSIGIEPYSYIALFETLNPVCYHFSDNDIHNTKDMHLHFGNGTFDFKRIINIVSNNKNIAVETQKNYKENLNDFILDSQFLRKLIGG